MSCSFTDPLTWTQLEPLPPQTPQTSNPISESRIFGHPIGRQISSMQIPVKPRSWMTQSDPSGLLQNSNSKLSCKISDDQEPEVSFASVEQGCVTAVIIEITSRGTRLRPDLQNHSLATPDTRGWGTQTKCIL